MVGLGKVLSRFLKVFNVFMFCRFGPTDLCNVHYTTLTNVFLCVTNCVVLCSALQCVILTEASLNLQKRVNEFCHSQEPPVRVRLGSAGSPSLVDSEGADRPSISHPCLIHCVPSPLQFISCSAHGICVRVFCDFGDDFEVSDPTGEEPKEIFIQSITQV